jgi:hypothetical protein
MPGLNYEMNISTVMLNNSTNINTMNHVCPKSNGLEPTNSTFLASSQLTTSIH